MKKLILLFALLFNLHFFANAQEVEQVQKTLLTKIAADWCPPCGSWGWAMWEDVIDENKDKAILMAVHHSGGLKSPTSEALSDNLNISGQPRFYLNNENQNVTAGSAGSKLTEITGIVDVAYDNPPVVGVGVAAYLTGTDQLTVDTKTRFFEAANANYYVAVYVVEDQFVSYQASIGNDAVHKRLLRTAVGDDHFGQEIINGSVVATDEFTHQFSMTVDPEWNLDNVEIVAVIWSKEGDTYRFANTSSTTEFAAPTSTSDLANGNVLLDVMPTISDRAVNIELEVKERQEDITIQVVDQLGRTVKNVFEGNLNNGTHQFQVNKSDVEQAGLFFTVVKIGDQLVTRKVIFQ